MILDFTGVNAPYEAPLNPDWTVLSGLEPLETSTASLVTWFESFKKPAKQ